MRRLLVAAAIVAIPAAAQAETVDQVAARYGLAGEILVAKGAAAPSSTAYGTLVPGGTRRHRPGQRWRLASISKQVTAALLLRDLPGMPAALDAPLAGGSDAANGTRMPTLRQLLTHHTGLANPDATAVSLDGVPGFYQRPAPDMAYCRSKAASPGAEFAYNNCDYLIAAQALGPRPRWPRGMAMAKPGERLVPGFVGGKPEPRYELASFGAAGGLTGTARDVLHFDRALLTGAFLTPAALAALWQPEGGRSYQALGQWVFPGTLNGCAAPKRIVQRDGEIGGVQTRNFIFPDDDMVVIVFTNRSADDFAMGEVWQGRGFAYDLLSAAACG